MTGTFSQPCLVIVAAGASVAISSQISLALPPYQRMLAISATLFLTMKTLVYFQWTRRTRTKLKAHRCFAFFFLWLGMDPTPWSKRRRSVSWGSRALNSFICLLIGSASIYCVRTYQPESKVLLLFSVSLAFHFGCMGLLTAFWRALGIPVWPLFRNILKSRSLADFWGTRWNTAYSSMMGQLIDRPLKGKMSKKARTLIIFLVSGLFHEAAITMPILGYYGLPTLFFVAQGLLVIILQTSNCGIVANRIIGASSLLIGLPFLFPSEFTEEIIVNPLILVGL